MTLLPWADLQGGGLDVTDDEQPLCGLLRRPLQDLALRRRLAEFTPKSNPRNTTHPEGVAVMENNQRIPSGDRRRSLHAKSRWMAAFETFEPS
jgi:hypothetical protein